MAGPHMELPEAWPTKVIRRHAAAPGALKLDRRPLHLSYYSTLPRRAATDRQLTVCAECSHVSAAPFVPARSHLSSETCCNASDNFIQPYPSCLAVPGHHIDAIDADARGGGGARIHPGA